MGHAFHVSAWGRVSPIPEPRRHVPKAHHPRKAISIFVKGAGTWQAVATLRA